MGVYGMFPAEGRRHWVCSVVVGKCPHWFCEGWVLSQGAGCARQPGGKESAQGYFAVCSAWSGALRFTTPDFSKVSPRVAASVDVMF